MESNSTSGFVHCSTVDTRWDEWILESEQTDNSEVSEEISIWNELITGESESEIAVKSIKASTDFATLVDPYGTSTDVTDQENPQLHSVIFGDYVNSVLQCPVDNVVLQSENVRQVDIQHNNGSLSPESSRQSASPPVSHVVGVKGTSWVDSSSTADDTIVQVDERHCQELGGTCDTSGVGASATADDETVVAAEEITTCARHSQNAAEKYCKPCDELACSECLSRLHVHHNTEPIADAIETKKRELVETFDILTENYIPKLQQRIVSNTYYSQKHEDSIEQLMNEVKSREETLQTLLQDAKTTRIAALLNYRRGQRENSVKMEAEWDERLIQLRDLVKEGHSVCTPGTAFDVVRNLSVTLKSMDVALREFKEITQPPTLTTPDVTEDAISDLFGDLTLEEIEHSTRPREESLELLSTFIFDKKSVWALVTLGEGSAWIGAHEDTTIRLVTKTGVVLRSVKLSSKVYDITVKSDGNLFISAVHDSRVWKLSSQREVTKFIKFKDMYPCGLYASSLGHILVGLVGGGLRDKKADSRQFVVKITGLGSVLQRFEKDEEGRPLYTLPYRIAEHSNGDICVVDWTDPGEARLVVINSTGNFKFTYTGFEDSAQAFRPGGLACTPAGMILVCDIYRDIIHVLNKDGQCTRLLNSRRLGGLYGPCDIGLDKDGFLWVGGCKGNVQCLRYVE